MHARIAAAVVLGLPTAAWSHAFDDRYDLPAPLAYFVAGAAAVVGLSFIVTMVFAHGARNTAPTQGYVVSLGPLLSALRMVLRVVGLATFALVVTAGFFGTGDPMMNLAPTMVWIIGWVGLSLVVACIGNVWPALDPWRTLFELVDAAARRLGLKRGITLGLPYPPALDAWPAVLLLLAIAWFELVYPQAAVPYRLASMLLCWSALTLTGMICFGREAWQSNADVFAVYFATLGRFAPIASTADARSIILRPPGRGLIVHSSASTAMVCFVIAMLSTVLFDGLMGGQAWQLMQGKLARAIPVLVDANGYRLGACGLVGVWLAFLAAYILACRITASLVRGWPTKTVAQAFALTLVPIAVAYNIAHNCSNLLVQGQQVIPLLSDPLGLKWTLFGAADYKTNIGLIDARTSWYVAIGAIVAGHVISIWFAHRVALREFGTTRRAMFATIPLTILMVVYTAISLSVIAEPMVKFEAPDAVISQ